MITHGERLVPKLIPQICAKYGVKSLHIYSNWKDTARVLCNLDPTATWVPQSLCGAYLPMHETIILNLEGIYLPQLRFMDFHSTRRTRIWLNLLWTTLHEVGHHTDPNAKVGIDHELESYADEWTRTKLREVATTHPDICQPRNLGWLDSLYNKEYGPQLRAHINFPTTLTTPILHDYRAKEVGGQLSTTDLVCNVLQTGPNYVVPEDRELVLGIATKLGLGIPYLDREVHMYYLYGHISRIRDVLDQYDQGCTRSV